MVHSCRLALRRPPRDGARIIDDMYGEAYVYVELPMLRTLRISAVVVEESPSPPSLQCRSAPGFHLDAAPWQQ